MSRSILGYFRPREAPPAQLNVGWHLMHIKTLQCTIKTRREIKLKTKKNQHICTTQQTLEMKTTVSTAKPTDQNCKDECCWSQMTQQFILENKTWETHWLALLPHRTEVVGLIECRLIDCLCISFLCPWGFTLSIPVSSQSPKTCMWDIYIRVFGGGLQLIPEMLSAVLSKYRWMHFPDQLGVLD